MIIANKYLSVSCWTDALSLKNTPVPFRPSIETGDQCGRRAARFNEELRQQPPVAQVLYDELNVAAVAITDTEKLLAFIGVGADHHLPGHADYSRYSGRPLPIMRWSMPTATKHRTAVRSIRTVNSALRWLSR